MYKKRQGSIIFLIIFISCIELQLFPVYSWRIDKISKVTTIVDGDSFHVTDDEIRLADVSAPEWDQPGGSQATNILTSLIGDQIVYLDTDPVKNYDRWVSVVYIMHNETHYKNINKILWDYGYPFYHDDHSNEFNPSLWTLYVRYASDPEPPSTPNQSPIAKIVGPTTGTTGSQIQFRGSDSYDPDGSIEQYYWIFGDGATSNSKNPSHTYSKYGKYTITLRVRDNEGKSSTVTTTCTVKDPVLPNKNPIAKINGPDMGIVNQTIKFTSYGTDDPDGNIIKLFWDFDDNFTSTFDHPEHTYKEEEKYRISLRVEDNDGAVTTVYMYCTIKEPPNEKPIAYIDALIFAYINQPIQFWSNRSYDPDGSITQYIWRFGDGKEAQEQNPSHTYHYPNNYTVSLKVIDNLGESAYTSTICIIEKTPNSSPIVYLPGEYNGTPGEFIKFNSNCSDDGYISEYLWNFGEGNTKNLGSNASYVYENEGTYTVTLTVTDDEGASNTASTICIIITEENDQNSNSLTGLFRNLGLLSILGIFYYLIKTQLK